MHDSTEIQICTRRRVVVRPIEDGLLSALDWRLTPFQKTRRRRQKHTTPFYYVNLRLRLCSVAAPESVFFWLCLRVIFALGWVGW